ncbi:MAG: T9SS type A sorting domain-containing protein, partial [Bacteroidota bacterium]
GIPDGQDRYPRFPLRQNVQQFRPVIDGTIEPGWPLVNDTVSYTQVGFKPQLYLSYDSSALYVALRLPNIAFPELSFDFQSDGWWWGAGNTIMKINISTGTFLYFRSWDASPEVRAYSGGGGMWDDDPDYQAHFNRRVISPNTVQLVSNISGLPVVQIEMKIPKRPFAGLMLQQGDSLKININYTKVNNDPYQWATTFDQYDFAKLVVGGTVDVKEQPVASSLPNTFSLEQNYPNPFNPSTEIRYQISDVSFVSLKVFDVLGREVATLLNEELNAGHYSRVFDGSLLASGVYFYRLEARAKDGGQGVLFAQTRKLVLVR